MPMQPAERADDLTPAWQDFCQALPSSGKGLKSLNDACSETAIAEVEARLGIRLPHSLVRLLRLANGQKAGSPGIFKSVSVLDGVMPNRASR
jgi:hypothetical protein